MATYYITPSEAPRMTFKVWTDDSGEIVEVDIADNSSCRALINQNLLPLLNAETIAELYDGIRQAHELNEA